MTLINPQRTDKRRVRGVETRRLILQSSVSSIAAVGLGSTTLDRVASNAKVSKALVIFHFKSKNQLFKEVLEFLGRRFAEGWDEIADSSDGTTMEKFLRLVEYDIYFGLEKPEYLSAWHAFWGESKGNRLYHELSSPRDHRYEGEMERLLAKFIEDEGYELGELPYISGCLESMLFGFWVKFHLEPEKHSAEKALANVRFYLEKVFPNSSIPISSN